MIYDRKSVGAKRDNYVRVRVFFLFLEKAGRPDFHTRARAHVVKSARYKSRASWEQRFAILARGYAYQRLRKAWKAATKRHSGYISLCMCVCAPALTRVLFRITSERHAER